MPQVVAIIPALVAIGATAAGATALTVAVVGLAASLAVGLLMGTVFKPRTQNGFAAEAQGRTQIVRSNVQPRNMIYGLAMTSGPLIFAASTDGNGKKNQFMHLVIALADHECDNIQEIYLGEDPVGPLHADGTPVAGKFLKRWGFAMTKVVPVPPGTTDYAFLVEGPVRKMVSVVATMPEGDSVPVAAVEWTLDSDVVSALGIPAGAASLTVSYETESASALVRVKKHLGQLDQAADADLVAEVPDWTWDHRLMGVCYVYIRLEYDSDIFPSGLPNVKALVKGKKLYDPRSGTTAWSSNWALCVYDYLREERGFGCTDADIDVQTVIMAANICAEAVPIAGGAQARYVCDGVVMLDKSPRDNLAEMVTACGGVVTITGGMFKLFPGAYDIPTVTLTESDLRGPVKVRSRISRKDLFNKVKGTFVDPVNYWQPSDFPSVSSDLYAQQDGEMIERDIELPFTTDAVAAQRLAKIILERSRQGITVEFPAKLTAFQLTAYSTVKVMLSKFGWSNKVFRVMSWKMSDDGGIDLMLNEEAAAVYDWSMGDATVLDSAPDTNLPNPFQVEVVGQIAMASGDEYLILSQSGVVTSRVRVNWPAPTEVALQQGGTVEVEYKKGSDLVWTALPSMPAGTTSVFLSPVEDGQPYVVRGRFQSAIGVRSPDWTYSPVHVVAGKLSPPSNMTGLSLSPLNGMANLTWDIAKELDVRNGGRARIRHTTDLVQPSWNSAIDIGGVISGAANSAQLPLLTGVYLGKWVDSTGHESPAATMVITTAPVLNDLNVVASIVEQPAFSGMKTNVVRDPSLNGIKLIGAGLIDDQGLIDATGMWDSQAAIDGLGLIDNVVGAGGWGMIDSLGGIVSSGTYQFAGSLDLGAVEKSRLTVTVDSVSFDTGDTIDAKFDSIDSWTSIDGDRISDTTVALYVRTTNDDPAGTPTWTDWQRFSMGDYEARAFQWKVEMLIGSPTHNLVVTGLSVSVDMPDRRESGRDVISGPAAKVITFLKPFRVPPVLGITAQDMAQGDYFTITSKSVSGFTVNFFTSAGAPVSRKFDWDAIAY